ncbi:hypothetical protein DRN76_04100 [Methanosarcinales archaeon]|nr:MAG: hypothetical protein DRN76_04100 [Methanosarcinales archaeon]
MSLLWTSHINKTETNCNQTNESRIKTELKLTAEFIFEISSASIVYQSIVPELSDQMLRSQITLQHTNNHLKLLIHAEDITALRASINSWLRIIAIADSLSYILHK